MYLRIFFFVLFAFLITFSEEEKKWKKILEVVLRTPDNLKIIEIDKKMETDLETDHTKKLKKQSLVSSTPSSLPAAAFYGKYKLSAENRDYWNKLAYSNLQEAINNVDDKSKIAKNVVMFLGSGMGPATVTAARIYKGQLRGNPAEEEVLSFDRFPHVALLKTYNTDSQVPDSAGAGTALLCGVKSRTGTVGVTREVAQGKCSSYHKKYDVYSILYHSAKSGKSVGIITNARITQASTSASYAHTPFRYWEDDTDRNKYVKNAKLRSHCPDIAQQLVNNAIDFRWIMGGGAAKFLPKSKGGSRSDGKDLIEEWKERQKTKKRKYKVLRSKADFDNFDPSTAEYVLALLAMNELPFQASKEANVISLVDMTEKAVKLLSRNAFGYFLFVEGGLIDIAHHKNQALLALSETLNLEKAVSRALELQERNDTLTVVTADHSHMLNLGEYSSRGRSLFDWKELRSPQSAGIPNSALGYSNRPSMSGLLKDGKARKKMTSKLSFKWPASVSFQFGAHSREDIALFARGPGSWMFYRTHEQNYVAHAIMMTSCVGLYRNHSRCRNINNLV